MKARIPGRSILFSAVIFTMTACKFAGLDREVIPAQKLVFSAGTFNTSATTKTQADTVAADTVAVIRMKNRPGQVVITRTETPLSGLADSVAVTPTKGSMLESFPNFRFFGYSYTGTVFGSDNSLFANDDTADYDQSTGTYISRDFYKNPASTGCRTRYYAYTPSPLLTANATAAGITLTYTAPKNLNQTKDLCIGVSGDYNSASVRPVLMFYHALSAVRFVIDNDAAPHLSIGSIGFRDLPKTATVTLPDSFSEGTLDWSVSSSADMHYKASQADIAGGYSTPWFFILPKDGSVQAVIDLNGEALEHSDLTSTLTLPTENGSAYTFNVSFDSSYHDIYLTPDPTGATLQFGESLDVTVTGAPPVADITLGALTSAGGAAATFASMTKTGATAFRITNNKREPGDAVIAGSLTTDKGGRASFSDITCKALEESISLTPVSTSIANGQTCEFTVSGVFPDGFTASVSGEGLVKVSQTASSVTLKNNSTSTSAGSGTLTVTTAIQSKTASAAITIERKPATFSDINPKALTWAYNETAAKTLTISGTYIIPSDISLSSLTHYTASVTSASAISVKPNAVNGTDAAYNETLDVTIGGVKKSVTLSQVGGKEIVSTETIYNDPTFNLSAPALIPASGGTSAAPAVSNIAQTCFTRTHYKDGSHSDSTPSAVANLSYTISYSKDNASFSTTHTGYTGAHLGTTVKAQTVLGTMYVNVSANGKSVTKSVEISQQANNVSYSAPSVSLSYPPGSVGAAGGTVSASVRASQIKTYTSGSTATNTTIDSKTFSGSATGFSVNASNGTVTVSSNTGAARSITVYVTVTMKGQTGSASASVSQSGDAITDYSIPDVSFTYSTNRFDSEGGTAYASVSYSQIVTYASGRTTTVTSGGSVGYSGSATGFSLNTSNGTVVVAANTSTSARSITVTASVTLNGKTGTKTATVSQDGDYIKDYSIPDVSFTYSTNRFGPEGGTVSPSLSYSQTVYYKSGNTTTITSGASSVSYSGGATGFSVNASNGTVTVSSNTGSARSITVTASVTLNGKTGTKTATVSQDGDYIKDYSTPSVTSFSYSPSSVGPAGGTASASVSYSQTVYYKSGNTTTITSGGSVGYSGSATGFSVNASNGTVTVSSNTGSARSITVTASVTLNGKTGTKTATVSQDGDYIKDYSIPDVSFSYSPNSFGPAGGTASASVSYSQTITYASGKKTTATSGGSVSYSGSATGFSVNASNGTVSVSANSGSARSITVTASVTLNGKTGSNTASVSQDGDYVTGYGDVSVSLSYSPNPISPAGGTATPNLSYSQTVYYASGRTTTATSGASVSYSGIATATSSYISLNTSNGTVTAEKNTSTNYSKSITVTASVTLNGKSNTASATVSQSADYISDYSTPSVSLSYPQSHISPAGDRIPINVMYSQTVYYASGTTHSASVSGASVSYSGSAEGFTLERPDKYGVIVYASANTGAERSITVTASVTLNGKTGTATATITQDGDYVKSCSFTSVSFSYSPSSFSAAGGTATPSLSYSQTVIYASGRTATVTSGASVTYSAASSSVYTLNTSNGTLSVTANTSKTERSIHVTVEIWLNGKYYSTSATVSQEGDYLSDYGIPSVTLSYPQSSLGPGSGGAYPRLSYSQTVYYASGKTTTITSGGSVSYSGSAEGFELDTEDGYVYAKTNNGPARSITVTASVTLNGKTGTATATITQEESYTDYIISYSTPSVTLSYSPPILDPGSGYANPRLSYSQTVTYKSGRTTTITSGGSVSYSGSAEGFELETDGYVYAKTNNGPARSITVTASVTLNGKTGTTTATITQEEAYGDYIISYSTPSVTLSYSPSSFHKYGGNAYPDLSYSQTVTHKSGMTETITYGGSVSYSGSATGFSVNASNGRVNASTNTGAERSITVTASVTLNGKTGTASVTLTQSNTY